MNDKDFFQHQAGAIRRPALIVIVLAIIIALAVWFFAIRPDAQEQASSAPGSGPGGGAPTPAVSAIAATRQAFPVYLSALGTVTSLHTIEVRPRVEGRLESVDFEEGQRVEKGQVLAQIDARSYQAELEQAQAQLKQDQAQLASARQDLARYRQLVKTSSVARQQLETQQQLVNQYEGAVEADKASIENARVSLDYTTIVAPVSGRIGIRNVDTGNIVQLGDENPIATLTQIDPISVIFSIPTEYLPALRQRYQNDATIDVAALNSDESQVLATGTLASIDSAIDTATGTIRMRARFDNAQQTLFPNEFVNVRLTREILANAVVVPEAALQTSEDGNYVYVVGDEGKVAKRAVTIQASDDTRAAIASGVQAGEQVVVDGVDNLRDGATVRIVNHSLPGENGSDDSTTPASADPAPTDRTQDSAS